MSKPSETTPISLEHAIRDPAAVFATPEEVLRDERLTLAEKLEILQRWAEDADRLAVAEAEGMGGGEPSMQGRVLAALNEIKQQPPLETHPFSDPQ